MTALLTGALHLDALADTADALGGTSRERSLEIMRDHAIGAFGAVALVVVCLVDASVLGALAAAGDAALAGLVAGAAGRAAILPLARALPYARSGPGQGRVLEGLRWWGVAAGIAVAAVARRARGVAGHRRAGGGGGRGGTRPRLVPGVARRRHGDALGATAKLCETAALVAFVAAA